MCPLTIQVQLIGVLIIFNDTLTYCPPLVFLFWWDLNSKWNSILISPFNLCLTWMTLCMVNVGNREKKNPKAEINCGNSPGWIESSVSLWNKFSIYTKARKTVVKVIKKIKNVCLQANNCFRLLVSYRGINPTQLSISTVLMSTFELPSRLHW